MQRFPRRPRRYVAVWRWDDGTYSAVMIGLGGERVTNSKAYPTRAEAEACAQGAADQSGLPFIACGLEAAPPGDGGGLAA